MLTVSTCYWEPNRHSAPASRCYEPHWVDRLAAGLRRNLTVPHRFVVFTDKPYQFGEGVEQELIGNPEPDWSAMIVPFRLGGPSIILGLDSIVTGNCDDLARYCLTADRIAIPLTPGKDFGCNGVVLAPAGTAEIYDRWRGEDDMAWVRAQPHRFIDHEFPGAVVSYKCEVRPNGLKDARIVFFHGKPKMADILDEPWVRDHWR